jgi:hypothetical protein
MFGKPEWFKPKTFGWGIHPICWQGWTWLGVWLVVILTPYIAFLADKPPRLAEGFIWLTAMLGVMLVDVYQILKGMNRGDKPRDDSPKSSPPAATGAKTSPSEVLFIGEDTPTNVATKNYDFRVRR